MSFQTWFRRQSIRKQALLGQGFILFIVFALAIGIFVGINKGTESRLIDGSREILGNDVVSKMSTILADKVNTFANLINQNVEGFLLAVGNTIQYTTKPDNYSLFPVDSFPDNDLIDLSPPVVVNSRSGGHSVSLSASSVLIPGQLGDGSNIPSLWTTYGDIINKTSHTDIYMKCLYENYTDVVAVYYGDDTSGMFRRYPGASSKLTDPTRSYDPRVRPWYTNAIVVESDVSISDPYLDAFGLGWMVTLSFRILSFDGSTVMGVVGLDLLIDTIRTNINDFQLEDSVSHLIQDDGIVLSSPEWTPTLASGNLFTVTDIVSPPISGFWDTILEVGNGHVDSDSHFIIFRHLVLGDKIYHYVTAVPKEKALSVVNQQEDDLKSNFSSTNVITISALLGGMVFVFICIIISTNMMTAPIRRSQRLAINGGEYMSEGRNLKGLTHEINDVLRQNSHNEPGNFSRAVGLAFQAQANRAPNTYALGTLPSYDPQTGVYPPPHNTSYHSQVL